MQTIVSDNNKANIHSKENIHSEVTVLCQERGTGGGLSTAQCQ